MDRSLLERWFDTTAFGIALGLSGAVVVPVLALGVLVTAIGGAFMIAEPSSLGLYQAVFGLLTVGGTLGFMGYLRAHQQDNDLRRYNMTATFVFLTSGVLAALSVGGIVLGTFVLSRDAREQDSLVALGALFTTANLVWAVAGIARMQRLSRRYAEKYGRVFETLPVILLFVAITLAVASAVATTTL
jgi:hypothetical protein